MDAYQLALEQGRKELATAQAEYRKLGLHIAQLEAIVGQLNALISRGNSKAASPLFDAAEHAAKDASTPPSVNTEPRQAPPLWKAILTALNGDKADFTVPQALKALERMGRTMGGQNRLNIIRNTLIQRDDIFGRLGTGHYFVRGYERKVETEKEATPEEIAS